MAAVSDSKLKNPVNRETRKPLSHREDNAGCLSRAGFPRDIYYYKTWKKDGNIVAVKGTLSRRYECEHKVLAAWRRAASRWRLFDAYLWQTGVQTDLIPVLAASSRHTQTWMQLCVCVRV